MNPRQRFVHLRALVVVAFLLALAASISLFRGVHSAVPDKSEPRLELQKGDHICIVGNTLADRMQHDGWLETLLQARLPQHQLSFRNLGFSADEVTTRLRSASFGSPDDWLARCQADVVFAFFGYNESFAGQPGLDKFKKDLDNFVKHTRAAKYNGKNGPRVVLFSPIAHEDLQDPNLPDGKANNERLELYTAAIAEVAKDNNVGFVDLFHPMRERYGRAKQPFTINGIHLNDTGNRAVAEIVDAALFPGQPKPKLDAMALDKLRQAVRDKNFYWFNRYRTVDGYSIYGGRSGLKFVAGQTNREVMQREMEVLDVMTANRDKRIWAVAQGGDLKVDDSNTPEFVPVVTNKPGQGPNGLHLFLDGTEAIDKMTVHKDMKVELFASEKQFPELINPVQMAFDSKGRLWVATWPTYPHWKPKEEMNDKLLILEDTDGDGKADKCKTFVSDLHNPTGFEFWNGGVLVAMAPDILFLKDTDGDDKADVRVRVVSGIDSADTHHTSSSFTLDPGGALYFQEGTFHHTQVETPYGPPERCVNAGVFRYDPRRQKFEVYVTYGFANPHGHVFDRWGQDFIHDGTGAVPYHGALFSGHLDFPAKHGRPPTLYKQRTRPCPGTEILSSAHFPAEIQDNLLVANVIGFQGILQYKINDKGSSFEGVEVEPIVSSTDPSFRPADLEVGPDGALYFTDWQNPIIGHMQHNLRDPSRDRKHGRVYRVTYKGRDLAKPVTIAGAPIDNVLDVLKNPDNRVRYRARIELSGRKTGDVIPAVKKWLGMLDAKDPNYQHHLLEALWVHQHHNVVDVDLLKRLLGSPDFRARAAATRVLCYWRESVPEALVLLKKQAADAHPRVRLEAVRAASFFKEPEAIEIPLISAEHPSDIYLDFTRGETMKALDPVVKAALAKGQTIHFTSDVGARYFLKNLSTEEILKMKRSRAVYLELLFRKGVRDELRREALAGLASDEKKKPIDVLVDAIRGQDELKSAQDESVVFDLVRLLTDRPAEELKGVRGELEKMAKSAQLPVTRQLGFAALIAADGSIDKAWATGVKSVAALHDLVGAMSLVRDPGLRAALYPKVAPLLDQLPDGLGSAEPNKKGTLGRFVRIELEGRRTLTLAEVEVLSGGRNVARAGKATQKNMAHNGPASNAIDGNKNGSYGGGGQTHTQENTPNPWWEVDLGAELPIDAIRIFNRTDGSLGKRLDNFTLKVLDQRRQEVFVQKNNPAPAEQVEFKLAGGGPESTIRRQAMLALTTVRGQEAATFKSLAKFVRDDVDRHAAIRALQRIPTKDWPAEEARPLLDSITGYVRKLPANERTTPAALDAMQLAYALTPLLPVEEARKARRDLGELGVRILRLGTLVDQMLYDKERLIVQAGKPVEIIFENNDLMPHNLVLLQPGSLEEVGLLGEASATDPGALARQFIPKSNKVLLASKLLQPRDVQQLSFTAPKKAGVYPYVCTYPGHWRRMFGALYVVEDLEEYLAGPEAYLAKHPLPIADELLKFNRPRKEWKFEELAGLVEKLEHGRSFANGKQIFSVASCVACHKLNGVGSEFGPDLTKPDPKLKSADILREIVEPSHRINEKFQTFIIETNAGKIHTGLILDEAGDAVKLIENPLAKAAPIVIKKSDIASRTKSPTSIMPKGLLDKLTQEEILDLVAYVLAKGDPKNMLFHGHHDH